MKVKNRPKTVIHDRPLYGKQFKDVEFGCAPTKDIRLIFPLVPGTISV